MGHQNGWRRHFFYQTVATRTTWKARIGAALLVVVTIAATSAFWRPAIARSLVCESEAHPADVILIDNFELNYLVFERAAELRNRGVAQRVLVPTQTSNGSAEPNAIFAGFAHVMAGISRLNGPELIPVPEVEPISLNAAYQIRDTLVKDGVRAVVLVSPGFRSRRSFLIYEQVLGPSGISTYCVPVLGRANVDTWSHSWHGIQQVAEQFLKLQYYRFGVLPFEGERNRGSEPNAN